MIEFYRKNGVSPLLVDSNNMNALHWLSHDIYTYDYKISSLFKKVSALCDSLTHEEIVKLIQSRDSHGRTVLGELRPRKNKAALFLTAYLHSWLDMGQPDGNAVPISEEKEAKEESCPIWIRLPHASIHFAMHA